MVDADYYISAMSWKSAAVIVITLVSCACAAARHPDAPLVIQPLELSAGDGSLAPQLTATGEKAIVSWIAAEGKRSTLKFAERTAAGWTAPRDVAAGDDWFTNFADVPTVLRLADGTLAAEWLVETDPRREAYDIKLAFSKDDGRTWSTPTSPHHDGTTTQHGFASLFQMPGAGLGLVWLDGRQTDNPENDNMSVRAAVFDRAGTETSETLVDDRVCDCCPTAVAIAAGGPVAAFRDRSPEEVRDIAVSRFVDGRWTPSTRVHADDWKIEACPVNGPAISAHGRTVVVAWMTAKDDSRAYAAFSNDEGATFGTPIRLDDSGTLGRVGVTLLDDGSAIASWIDFANKRAQLQLRRIEASGARGAAQTVAGLGGERTNGYPRLVRRGNELVFAWTEGTEGVSKVRTAAAKLP
jgi:hypothetical protein